MPTLFIQAIVCNFQKKSGCFTDPESWHFLHNSIQIRDSTRQKVVPISKSKCENAKNERIREIAKS